jgi:hypothetical protein
MTTKRQFAERPHRQKYNEYNGVLGIVVGIEEKRRDSGHIKYKIKCADCGEIHIRSASQLKNGRKSRQCDNFKPHNKLFEDRRDGIMRRQYGITLEQYDEMLEEQNYRCAICNNEDEVEGRRLAIDHCHTTGVVRGLLCGKCNRGIGLFYDSRELLERAINYLNKDNLVD